MKLVFLTNKNAQKGLLKINPRLKSWYFNTGYCEHEGMEEFLHMNIWKKKLSFQNIMLTKQEYLSIEGPHMPLF